MTTLSSQESYTARAQKIHAKILESYKEAVESIDKLKLENPDIQLYLLREANIYADDLNRVVFNLTQVIFKINKEKNAHRDLQQIITILCGLTGAIHKSFLHDHEKIKTELKKNIQSATEVAERLLDVIRLDDIHEHKQEILNNQSDVLLAVDKVYVTNLIKLLNPQQLEDVVQDEVNAIKSILLNFDSKEPNIEQTIIQCTKHNFYNFGRCIDHATKAVTSGHFNDEIKKLFLEIIETLNDYNSDMHQIVLQNSQFDQLLGDVHKVVAKGVGATFKVIPLLAAEQNKEVSDSGLEIAVFIYANAVGSAIQLRRSLENAKLNN